MNLLNSFFFSCFFVELILILSFLTAIPLEEVIAQQTITNERKKRIFFFPFIHSRVVE